MKNIIFNSLIIILSFSLNSCNENTNQNEKAEESNGVEAAQTETPPLKCTYSVNTFKTKVQWTAYKTSDLIPVKGIFENVAIQSRPNLNAPHLLIEGTKFEINPMSVNSNNPERDKLLVSKFFKVVIPDMYGEFKEVEGDATSGKGVIDLHWNGQQQSTAYKYTINNDTILISTDINLKEWKAEEALKSINNACKLKHTGADGKSLTSDNVKVDIKVVITKKCF